MSSLRQSQWELAFAFAADVGVDNPEEFANDYEAMIEDLHNVVFYPDRPYPTPQDFYDA